MRRRRLRRPSRKRKSRSESLHAIYLGIPPSTSGTSLSPRGHRSLRRRLHSLAATRWRPSRLASPSPERARAFHRVPGPPPPRLPAAAASSSSPPPPPPLALPALAFRLLSAFSSSDSAALRSSRARSRALSSTIAVPSLSTNDDEKLPAPSCASVPSRTDSRARRSRCSPRSLKAACRSASRSASTPARFATCSASCSPRTAATSARRSCIAPDAASASAFALSASALAASVSPRLFASSSRSRAFSASSRPLSASAAAPVGFPAAVAGDTPAGGGRSFGA
mmetsp:Transcript_5522/g.18018  ORF Transcript_5522/g.18018 Transcript_5522/m.18018 type:complete len:282 (-) Transcript_5522:423-1268(-)